MLFSYGFAILFEILFPIILGFVVIRRYRTPWKYLLVGVLTFIGSQVLHIPFLVLLTNLFSTHVLPTPPAAWTLAFNSVMLGLLAGIFEESARAVGYALIKPARSWADGITFGIGHGGIESIFVGVSVLANVAVMWALRENSAALNNIDVEALQSMSTGFWSTPWHLPLAGAVERFSAIALHLSLSILVLQAFTRRNAWYFAAGVFWHALVDGAAVYLSGLGWNAWALEGIVFAFALISLYIVYRFRDAPPIPPTPQVE